MLIYNIDWEYVCASKNDKTKEKYKEFYLDSMEELYKASMRHAAIGIANAKDGEVDKYNKIYSVIEEYVQKTLPIKPETNETKEILDTYKKFILSYDTFTKKDFDILRKNLCLLGIGRKLFVYSFPTIAADQCYTSLITNARVCLGNSFVEADKFESYNLLLDTIEEYIDNILCKKNYWDNPIDEDEFKKTEEKWGMLKKLARIDYDDYKKQREILFVKNDLKEMKKKKINIQEVKDYYRDRMLQLKALRQLSNHYGKKLGTWRTKRRLKAD